MKITDLIKRDTIILDLNASNKVDVINELSDKLYTAGKLKDKDKYVKDVLSREEQSSTGIGEGIAIPHAKSDAVNTPAVAFGRTLKGIEYDSFDGQPAYLFFMIAVSEGAHSDHLEILSKLSTLLMDSRFREEILIAKTECELLNIIDEMEREISGEIKEEVVGAKGKILAVTACPTGISHTYMAAEALKNKGKEMNVDIKVETNGSSGVKNRLTEEDIKDAVAIIVAADKKVEMERFHGKIVIQVSVKEAIQKPSELISKALNKEGKVFKANEKEKYTSKEKWGREIYKYLMNGISNMLPFVVGGGILIALAFVFDYNNAGAADYGSGNPTAKLLMDLGKTTFGLMLPVLSGFIASAIADRPGLAPGFVGGALAFSGGAGFLGALAAGFIAGYIVLGIKKFLSNLPQSLEGIKPVFLLPIFGVLFVGIVMKFGINPPVAAINTAMNTWLSSLSASNKILLGLILGGMMAVDMGGPINKAAYVFGVASITEGNGHIMAAVMAGGIVPPLGIAIATTFFKNKFTKPEQQAGKANYVMGLSFITEGAIPFAAKDPKAVLPSIIVGSSIAGALSMIFGASSPAPHGGIFIFPLVNNWHMYLISILIGSIITAILLNILKKPL